MHTYTRAYYSHLLPNTCLPTCLLAHLPTYLLACLPACACLDTYAGTCVCKCVHTDIHPPMRVFLYHVHECVHLHFEPPKCCTTLHKGGKPHTQAFAWKPRECLADQASRPCCRLLKLRIRYRFNAG